MEYLLDKQNSHYLNDELLHIIGIHYNCFNCYKKYINISYIFLKLGILFILLYMTKLNNGKTYKLKYI